MAGAKCDAGRRLGWSLTERNQASSRQELRRLSHSKIKQGGFDLSTREALLKEASTAKWCFRQPESSQLYKLVAHVSEPGMPLRARNCPTKQSPKSPTGSARVFRR